MRTNARIAFTVSLAALTLTACGNDVSIKNATPEEVSKQVSKASTVNMKPGEWETTVETLEVEMPGMTGAMKDQMTKALMDTRQTMKTCISEEEAKKPPMDRLTQMQDCTYEKYELDGGDLDSTLVCKVQGSTMRMEIDGKLASETFDMENEMETTMPGGSQKIKTKARVTGRYLGPCPATAG